MVRPDIQKLRRFARILVLAVMNSWNNYVSGKSAGWTALFTGVLVVFTAILAWVAYKANENSVITQRAFVNFNTIAGTKAMTADGKSVQGINFLVSWTNSGTTPTKRATSVLSVTVLYTF
jgi:hypothetical protein